MYAQATDFGVSQWLRLEWETDLLEVSNRRNSLPNVLIPVWILYDLEDLGPDTIEIKPKFEVPVLVRCRSSPWSSNSSRYHDVNKKVSYPRIPLLWVEHMVLWKVFIKFKNSCDLFYVLEHSFIMLSAPLSGWSILTSKIVLYIGAEAVGKLNFIGTKRLQLFPPR